MPDRASHTRGHRPPAGRARAPVPVVRSRGRSPRRSSDVDCSRGDVDARGDAYSSPAGASQGQTKRSTSATAPKSTMAMSDRRIIELNASSVFQSDVADSMMYPRPLSEPANAPTTAPITDSLMATLAPAKKNGIAIGSRTFTNVLKALARYERLRSSSSGGVAASPVAVSTTTGKKATRNATNTLGISPWPSTSSSTGAIAIFGTDWASTISGYSALLITGE